MKVVFHFGGVLRLPRGFLRIWFRRGSSALAGLALVGLLVGLFVGCSFDSSELSRRACGAGGCGPEQECCEGYCVPLGSCRDSSAPDLFVFPDSGPDLDPTLDRDFDGIANSIDNCPDVANPEQLNVDRDSRGDACDCAPTDSAFQETVLDINTFDDPQPFAGVEFPANWSLVGGVLQQTSKDGVQRAITGLLEEFEDYLVLVVVQFSDSGDDGLVFPAPDANASLAGMALRTSDVAPGRGNGYYCAIDRANLRLVVGQTAADDLSKGKLDLFPDLLTPPGKAINRQIRLGQSYPLTMRVVDDQLSCRVLLPDLSRVEMTIADSRYTKGKMALFSAGAGVLFESVKICAK